MQNPKNALVVQQTSLFAKLPQGVLIEIFKYFDEKELAGLRQICKQARCAIDALESLREESGKKMFQELPYFKAVGVTTEENGQFELNLSDAGLCNLRGLEGIFASTAPIKAAKDVKFCNLDSTLCRSLVLDNNGLERVSLPKLLKLFSNLKHVSCLRTNLEEVAFPQKLSNGFELDLCENKPLRRFVVPKS